MTCGSLGLPHYITLIYIVWPTIVMWLTRLMTWLDTTVLIFSCSWWCSCQAAVLLRDGCALGVSQLHLHLVRCVDSLIFLGFPWCCMCTSLAYLYFGMLHMFVCSWKITLACIICSWKIPLTCIIHSSIREHISLHVLSLFISSVVASCPIHVPIFAITHNETTSNPQTS